MNSQKVIGYTRVSGTSQIEGDGFERQLKSIENYVKRNNLTLVETYRDGGVPGATELEGREGLTAIINRVKLNGIRIVLVERADRLARDLMTNEIILEQFRDADAKVIEADSGVELTAADGDPTKILIRQVLAAVSQFDKATTVAKLKAARDRKRATEGRCEGPKPYGTLPGEKEVLERIRRLRRKPRGAGRRPMSFRGVAEVLNREEIPTRYGRTWHGSSIQKILRNV